MRSTRAAADTIPLSSSAAYSIRPCKSNKLWHKRQEWSLCRMPDARGEKRTGNVEYRYNTYQPQLSTAASPPTQIIAKPSFSLRPGIADDQSTWNHYTAPVSEASKSKRNKNLWFLSALRRPCDPSIEIQLENIILHSSNQWHPTLQLHKLISTACIDAQGQHIRTISQNFKYNK